MLDTEVDAFRHPPLDVGPDTYVLSGRADPEEVREDGQAVQVEVVMGDAGSHVQWLRLPELG